MRRIGSVLGRHVPAVDWLRAYRRSDVRGDLSAGVTVAVMLVPQGMAYALLAGLPPVVGLYASAIPLLVYAFFGGSRQLSVGPVAIDSLLTLAGVSALAAIGSPEFVALAVLLALMVGVIELALGLFRAGFLVNFVSHAVISGFTSAAAIVIGLSQLKNILGIETTSSQSAFGVIFEAGRHLPEINPTTAAIGLGSIAVLVLAKKVAPRFPAPVLVVALGTFLTYYFGLHERGVGIVGEVPGGLPGFALPTLDAGAVVALLPTALTISFIGFMEAFAVAKSIAAREGYKIEANREFKGLGLANIGSSLFSGYPVTGGFSRSAVNYEAGARTPLASVVTAVLVLVALAAFTPLFYYLPNAVLAAIVLVAVYGLIDVETPVRIFEIKPTDGWILIVTFVSTLVIGVQWGILIGIAFSLLVFVWRSAYPHTAKLGYLPEKKAFRNVERFPEARTFPDTIILRVDGSLYFANMAFLETQLREVSTEQPGPRRIILDFSGVNSVDAVAIETLEKLIEDMGSRGIGIHIAGMKGPVRDIVKKAGWPEKFGPVIDHFSIEDALEFVGLWKLEKHGSQRSEAGR